MPPTLTPRQQFEQQIARLVEKFDRQRAHYLSTAYNETDVRAEFIDPLFEAPGWDVSNRAGQEVCVELQGNADSARSM